MIQNSRSGQIDDAASERTELSMRRSFFLMGCWSDLTKGADIEFICSTVESVNVPSRRRREIRSPHRQLGPLRCPHHRFGRFGNSGSSPRDSRFLIKELYAQAEIGDEATKTRAKRSLEVVKKSNRSQSSTCDITIPIFPM